MQIADVFYLCPAAGAGRDPVEKDCQACAKARTLCAILCEMPCGGLPRDALRPISVGQNAASEKRKSFHAEVVELVDTLGSGSSSRKGVGVRVSPSAP